MLAVAGCSVTGVNAQSTAMKVPGGRQTQVCRAGQGKNQQTCYTTKYAGNFRVCQSDEGYFICGEEPTCYNSTFLKSVGIAAPQHAYYPSQNAIPATRVVIVDPTVPQSQSYVNTPAASH